MFMKMNTFMYYQVSYYYYKEEKKQMCGWMFKNRATDYIKKLSISNSIIEMLSVNLINSISHVKHS